MTLKDLHPERKRTYREGACLTCVRVPLLNIIHQPIRQVWSNTETEDVSMDDRLIKLGMSLDFSGFRETENENDKKCNTGN